MVGIEKLCSFFWKKTYYTSLVNENCMIIFFQKKESLDEQCIAAQLKPGESSFKLTLISFRRNSEKGFFEKVRIIHFS